MKLLKKALMTGALVMALSGAAIAGPLLGLQVIPSATSTVAFEAGWAFADGHLVLQKDNLATIHGDFSLAAIWTPSAEGFKYRGGVGIDWHYGQYDRLLKYTGLNFIVGVQRTWSPFTAYGELQISSTGVFVPVVGVDVLFDLFGPSQPAVE